LSTSSSSICPPLSTSIDEAISTELPQPEVKNDYVTKDITSNQNSKVSLGSATNSSDKKVIITHLFDAKEWQFIFSFASSHFGVDIRTMGLKESLEVVKKNFDAVAEIYKKADDEFKKAVQDEEEANSIKDRRNQECQDALSNLFFETNVYDFLNVLCSNSQPESKYADNVIEEAKRRFDSCHEDNSTNDLDRFYFRIVVSEISVRAREAEYLNASLFATKTANHTKKSKKRFLAASIISLQFFSFVNRFMSARTKKLLFLSQSIRDSLTKKDSLKKLPSSTLG